MSLQDFRLPLPSRTTASIVLALVLIASPAAADPPYPIEESVGVRAGVSGDAAAVAVVWNVPVEEREAPGSEDLLLAAELAVEKAIEGRSGASGRVTAFGSEIVATVELAEPGASELVEIAATLASPDLGLDAGRGVRRARFEERRDVAHGEPSTLARLAAARALLGSLDAPAESLFGPAGIAEAVLTDDARLARGAARLSSLPIEVRAMGPAGLATRLGDRLASRLRTTPASTSLSARESSRAVVVSAAAAGESLRGEVAFVVEYFVAAGDAADLGSKLPLLAEVLRTGRGSLSQRVSVAGVPGATSRVELLSVAGGHARFRLQVTGPASGADDLWRVLAGTVSSLQSLPLPNVALVEARKRLDARARSEKKDPTLALRERVLHAPGWSWPPADRWKRPDSAAELQAAAMRLFVADRRSIAVAGEVPASLLRANPFPDAVLVPIERFCPGRPELRCGTIAASPMLARLKKALGSADEKALPPGFAARYVVREETPAGPGETTFEVASGRGLTSFRTDGLDGSYFAEVSHADGEIAGSSSPSRFDRLTVDRIESFALRQPAVLLGALEAGRIPHVEDVVACAGGRCPAIRAELPRGSELQLVLDPETHLPRELRAWWCCGAKIADEVILFTAWKREGGLMVARSMEARGAEQQESREIELVDWSWLGD